MLVTKSRDQVSTNSSTKSYSFKKLFSHLSFILIIFNFQKTHKITFYQQKSRILDTTNKIF